MQPIIDYHGFFFQWLCRAAMRIGYEPALFWWRAGLVSWLVVLSILALTNRFKTLFTAIMLVGVGLFRLPVLGLGEQNVDESQWIVSAATLIEEPHFWQSVDGTTSGPINVWFPALMYYFGIRLDYATIRLWGVLTCVLPTLWLLLATFRSTIGERFSRLTMVPLAACLALATEPDAVAFNSEQLPMLLLALSGYLLSRLVGAEKRQTKNDISWLLMLGLVLGCLPYTKLQATPIGLLIAGWVCIRLYCSGPVRSIPILFFITGGLLPTVLIGMNLLATGLLDYAFRSYILTNLEYAQAGSWGVGSITWLDRLTIRLPQIYGSMPTTVWFWCLALGLALLAIISKGWHAGVGRQLFGRGRFVVAVCLVSVYVTLQPGNPFAHYQWLSVVPVCWLTGLAVHQLLSQTSGRLVMIVYLGLGVSYPIYLGITRPNPGITQLASGGWPSPARARSEAIRHYARPNEKMVVWGWANNLHVETGLLMGTRFIPLYFPVVPGPQQAYFLDVYRQDLVKNRPTIIVDARKLHPGNGYARYPISRYPTIQAILDTQYRLVQTVDGAKIYVRQQ